MLDDPAFRAGRAAYRSGKNFNELLLHLSLTAEQKQKFASGWAEEERYQRVLKRWTAGQDIVRGPSPLWAAIAPWRILKWLLG